MPPQFEVVVGTYEQFTLGYKIDKILNDYKMERTFAMHTHLASVRSIASKKNYLASAAADNTVCLYDMRQRIESGKLMHHTDTVNCISFTPDASHVITGSKDGSMAIIRCGNWQIEKHWESPHKGLSVDTLAIHPTGKLALTTGGDGVLRTWNLIKGRQAYATNLVPRWKSDAKFVSVLKWTPNGEKYAIGANKMIDVYSVATAGIDEQLSFDTKVICAEFLNDNLIAVGLMDGKLIVYDVEEGSKVLEISAHNARLRCMARDGDYLVTASSDGEIKVWTFTNDSLNMLGKANCDARILCMTLSMPEVKKLKNSKKNDEEEEEEEKVEDDEEDIEDEDETEELKKKTATNMKGFVRVQRVVVEDEGEIEEMKKQLVLKKKMKNKNKRSMNEKEDEDAKNVKANKKLKTDLQKRKNEEEDEETSPKKKKKLETNDKDSKKKNKRKSLDGENEMKKKKPKIENEKETKQGENKVNGDILMSKTKKKKRNKKKNKMLNGGVANSKIEKNGVVKDKSINENESVNNSKNKMKNKSNTNLLIKETKIEQKTDEETKDIKNKKKKTVLDNEGIKKKKIDENMNIQVNEKKSKSNLLEKKKRKKLKKKGKGVMTR